MEVKFQGMSKVVTWVKRSRVPEQMITLGDVEGHLKALMC